MIAGARQDQEPEGDLEMTSFLENDESGTEKHSFPYYPLSNNSNLSETAIEQAGNFLSAVAGGAGYDVS